jgi:hypothetical protein
MLSLHRPALIIGLFAAACRAAPPYVEGLAPGATVPDTLCALSSGPAPARDAGRDTLSVALPEPVDPAHAPAPKNDTERLVFRQLYETLIRVDCTGHVLAGLARSAERSARDTWTFALRDEARFWDGAPVTTRDVVAAWRARDSALAQSVTIIDEHTLTVRQADTPFQPFADPALAVSKPAPGGGWPIGTGGYWVTGAPTGGPDLLVASPIPPATRPVLKLATVVTTRLRDALDEGADLLLTGDPAVLEYAGSRPGHRDVPLEWHRTYVLLAPGRPNAGFGAIRRESLREAVHLDARPAEPPGDGRFWFTDLKACGLPQVRDAAEPGTRRQRVVYDQTDRSAADLAARLVGLGAVGPHAVATGLSPGAFAAALESARDAAYVLALRRRVFDVCRAARELPPWISSATIEPLVDVRWHAVARRGVARLSVDWDGTLRLGAP